MNLARCAMFALAFMVGAPAVLASAPSDHFYPAGTSDHRITSGGTERQFRVHRPSTNAPLRAIVLVLHGGGGQGLGVAEGARHPLAVFRTLADRDGFLVVYPAGLPSRGARDGAGWVDCRTDNKVTSLADDIGFLSDLIMRVRRDFAADRLPVFVAGGSNGAQMAHALAFNRADLLSGVASSSGSLPSSPKPGPCTTGPSRPLPILIVHGTADTQMPWGGGCVANLGGACNRGQVISAEATRDRWLAINGLSTVVPRHTVVELDPRDGGPAHRYDYEGAAPLQWWRLDGAGHSVASKSVPIAPNRLTGIQNRDIEFAEIAWDFFRQQLPATAR